MSMTETWFTTHGDSSDPVLLCLHGIGSCADAFRAQLSLADRARRRVVAWDAPGYRRSPDPPALMGLDDWADAAAELIERELGGCADLLGVSWGGVIAARLVLRHPELVRTLVLVDSSVGAGTNPDRAAAMRGRADELRRVGAACFSETRAPHLVSPDAPPELVRSVAEMMAASIRLPGYGWACESMAATDHRPDLGGVMVPTLVLVGEHDVVTPARRAHELASLIPQSELATVAGAGHLANQERPVVFNDLIEIFLKGHQP